jgi:hypothetical protein
MRILCAVGERLSTRRWMSSLVGVIVATTVVSVGASGASGKLRAHAAYQPCNSVFSPTRDNSNPLGLAANPGPDPLNGANFFVNGPKHGMAAGAIAQLLGIDPSIYPDSYSWAQFAQDLNGPLASKWQNVPTLAHQIMMLAKIAGQPEAQRLSLYSGGGGPGAIQQQVTKILCYNATADPGAIPLVETFFIYPNGQYCPSLSQIVGNWPTFKRQIDELTAGTGSSPVVYLLELDSIGSSACLSPHRPKHKPAHKPKPPKHVAYLSNCGAYTTRLGAWECELRYEVDSISALPHTVVYTEAGYKDGTDATYAASVLNSIDIGRIRGFYTNDTHNDWTHAEERWGQQVSSLTGGAHFIVNTSETGQGPLLNPHPSTQGVEQLCNAPGRGLGPFDTTSIPNLATYPSVDAFLWVHTPGRSSGTCNGGPAPGDFWWQRAVQLAENASSQLGP